MLQQIFIGVITALLTSSVYGMFKILEMVLKHEAMYKHIPSQFEQVHDRHKTVEQKLEIHDKRLDGHDVDIAVIKRGGQDGE